MKNIIQLIIAIASVGLTAQASSTFHVEGQTPVGPFRASLRAQTSAIEELIINKAKSICVNDSRFYFSNLKISTISGGGVVDLTGATDSLNALDSAISMGQPHSSYSVDISCQ